MEVLKLQDWSSRDCVDIDGLKTERLDNYGLSLPVHIEQSIIIAQSCVFSQPIKLSFLL